MTKSQIIEQIANDRSYSDYVKKVCNGRDIHKDLYQYSMLTVMEMEESKMIEVHGRVGIKAYMLGLIYKSLYGNRSRFMNEYNGMNTEELTPWHDSVELESLTEIEAKLNKFDEALKRECERCENEGVYPTAVKIYEIYEEKGSYAEVARCTGIPYKTVQRFVHNTRETILKNIDEDTDSDTE